MRRPSIVARQGGKHRGAAQASSPGQETDGGATEHRCQSAGHLTGAPPEHHGQPRELAKAPHRRRPKEKTEAPPEHHRRFDKRTEAPPEHRDDLRIMARGSAARASHELARRPSITICFAVYPPAHSTVQS
eukprot:gene15972-biopygen12702